MSRPQPHRTRHGLFLCLVSALALGACLEEPQFYKSDDLAPDLPDPGESFDPACSNCHGDGTSPAPPRNLSGQADTSLLSVGAHRAHLVQSASSTFHAAILCSSCHLVPEETGAPGHLDDGDNRAELTFGGLATAGGAVPTMNEDGSCSNVYCHGSTLGGGSLKEPVWTQVDGTQRECGTCHGAPPPAPHPEGGQCGSCHPSMSASDNTTFLDPSLHINGVVDLFGADGGGGAAGCSSCHGSDGNPAPPTDLAGNTGRDSVGVGAHREHLALSSWRREINCSNCHQVPTSIDAPGHIDGDDIAEVPFDALNPNGTVELATGTCSNLYCHGNGRANNGSASWTDTTPLTCDGCHQSPLPGRAAGGMSGEHDKHIRDEDMLCSECHAQVVDGAQGILAPALHID